MATEIQVTEKTMNSGFPANEKQTESNAYIKKNEQTLIKKTEKEVQLLVTRIVESGSVTRPLIKKTEKEVQQLLETKIVESGSVTRPLIKKARKENQFVGKGFEVTPDIPLTKNEKMMLTALLMFIYSSFGVAVLLTAFYNKH